MADGRGRLRWASLTRHDARDLVLFVCGLLGIFYETVLADQVSEVLVLLFAAMLGLPAFFRSDSPKGRDDP